MKVTAVVLTLDGRELLERMLPTLIAQDVPRSDRRLVVLDDGSTDGSPDWVEQAFPEVQVARNPRNLGIARSFNRAVELATGSDYLALLNNDIELEPDYLSRVVAVLDGHPEAASASGKMLNARDPSRLDGAGDVFYWRGAANRRGHGEPDLGQYDTPEEVFGACGGVALYRMAALADVGAFDEDFFAYYEDIDWAFRAQLRGWASRYEPAAVVRHVGQATTGRDAAFFRMLRQRNQLLVVVKDYPRPALLRHAPKLAVHQAGLFADSLAARAGAAHLRALGQALRMLPSTLRKRRIVQDGRTAPLARLDAIVTPEPTAGHPPVQRLRSMIAAARLARRERRAVAARQRP